MLPSSHILAHPYPLRLRFGTTASVTFTCYSSVGSRRSRVSTWITPVWVAAARYELVCVRRPPPTRDSWARCLLSTASSPDRRSCSLSRRWFLRAFVLLVTISARYRRRSTSAGSEDNEIRRRTKYAERVSTPVGWEFSLVSYVSLLGFLVLISEL